MDLRDDIAKAVDAWATHAVRETYLSERLHAKARGWLIDRIETMLREKGVSTVGPVAGPKGSKPVPPEPVKVAQPAPEKIITGTDKMSPADLTASSRASAGASEGPATLPVDTEPTPTMEDLKGKLKGQKKGKRA